MELMRIHDSIFTSAHHDSQSNAPFAQLEVPPFCHTFSSAPSHPTCE